VQLQSDGYSAEVGGISPLANNRWGNLLDWRILIFYTFCPFFVFLGVEIFLISPVFL
jgi:hypothetical protein